MIGFLRSVLYRAWWAACAASTVPIGFKASHHDMGRWKVTQWTWPETVAPAAALLAVEATLLCLRRCLCHSSRDKPLAPTRGRRTRCVEV